MKDKGNAALQENRLDDAISAYTEAINLDGNNEILYSNRSAAYAKAEKFERALEDAEKAVQLKPSWSKVKCYQGFMLMVLSSICLTRFFFFRDILGKEQLFFF